MIPGRKIAPFHLMQKLWLSTDFVPGEFEGPFRSILSIPSTRKYDIRSLGLFVVLIITQVLGSSPAAIADRFESRVTSHEHDEHSLARRLAHVAEFSPISAFALAVPKCASVRQPEPLVTPDPVFPPQDADPLVGVSFIVGSDGHVHSAFVTQSGGALGDQAVLRAIRGWRYRPALCNGVPTDSEARVRFSAHE